MTEFNQNPTPPQTPRSPDGSIGGYNLLSMVSMICAFLGLFTFITAIPGAITGHIARKQIRETKELGEGFALTGIILSYSILALGFFAMVFIFIIFGSLTWTAY